MARNETALPVMVADLPRYDIRKGELQLPPDQVYSVVEGLRAHYAHRSPESVDGLRVMWEDAWLHARASNTEPLLRIIVEARTAERADEIFELVMRTARKLAGAPGGARHAG